jgi:hypothetical protein
MATRPAPPPAYPGFAPSPQDTFVLGHGMVNGQGSPVNANPDVRPILSEAALNEKLGEIVSRLSALAADQVRQRQVHEQRWLEDLRQFHGQYDATLLRDLEENYRAQAYVKLTRKKTNAYAARLSDLLFPTDDKNWGISPTPVPELTRHAEAAAQQAQQAAEQATQAAGATAQAAQAGNQDAAAGHAQREGAALDVAQSAITVAASMQQQIDEANKTCSAMEREIDDQLTQCHYPAACRDAIDDACKLGIGIVKGPLVGARTRGSWTRMAGSQDAGVPSRNPENDSGNLGPANLGEQASSAGISPLRLVGGQAPADQPNSVPVVSIQGDGSASGGQYTYTVIPDPAPVYEHVNPWDFFPDMSAAKMEDAEFVFQRHLWTRKDLRRLVRELGFDADAVRRVLADDNRDRPLTEAGLSYLADLRNLTNETQPIKGRYVGWEYHGPLEADEIADMLDATGDHEGAARYRDDQDPLGEFMVIAYFCGGELLKIAPEYPLDSQETLFSVFPFEAGEASIFGYGVPYIMRDSQRSLNAAWRMILDNAALACSPQIIVDKGQLEPDDGDWRLRPRKMWRRVRGAEGSNTPAFEAVPIESNTNDLVQIINIAKEFANEETALPVQAEGEMPEQVNETLGAAAMRTNAANIVFRRIVKAFDDGITLPCIRRAYDWNMQFSKDDSIKGDMEVDARGVSALMAKELQQQQLMALSSNWLNNPAIAPLVRSRPLIEQTLRSMQLPVDAILKSQDEIDQAAEEQAQQAQQQPPAPAGPDPQTQMQLAQLDAETKQQIAQIEAQARIQIASITAQSKTETNQTQLQIEGMTLAEQRNMSDAETQARLAEANAQIQSEEARTAAKIDSEERQFATEVQVETTEAERDRQMGALPDASGGHVSVGAKPFAPHVEPVVQP